ncbi:MAG: YbaY family lipoprotein [Burkholderiales bacterium]
MRPTRSASPRFLAALAVLAAVVLSACASSPAGDAASKAPAVRSTIQGSIVHRDRKALPEDAEIRVWLAAIGEEAPIAETRAKTQGKQVPLPFALDVDLTKVEAGRAYFLHASIAFGGRIQYVTGARVGLVPAEPPTSLTILVVPGTVEKAYAEAEAPANAGPMRGGPPGARRPGR